VNGPGPEPFEAVLFDLFDTLVLFERDRLPELTVNGRTTRSTAASLHEALHAFAPHVELADFVGALGWSWQEAERIRNSTHREVAAPERFQTLFRRLEMDPSALPADAIPTLLAVHMRELARAVVFPDHHRALLEGLRRRHRLAVVSNFDYTPTARFVLERAGVVDLFDTIVVSDAVGWRKPAPAIFTHALEALGVPARRALFVGDRVDLDVAGAQGSGMRAAWINRAGEALPEGARPPEYEIRDLAELADILRAR
jgi:HAD superfamily hydrolase (TIGR01509 family)